MSLKERPEANGWYPQVDILTRSYLERPGELEIHLNYTVLLVD